MRTEAGLSRLARLAHFYRTRIAGTAVARAAISPFLRVLGNTLIALKGLRLPPEFSFWGKIVVASGYQERETVALLRKIVKPGMVVIDVGANVGYVSRLLSRLVGTDGHVYAFEPSPETFKFLQYNTRRCANVEQYNLAVADRDTEMPFYLHPASSSSNSLFNLAGSFAIITVRAVSLDSFMQDRSVAHIDLAKIDVEGAEPAVIRGMKRIIAAQDRMLLIVELCPAHLKHAGVDTESFLSEIRQLGFAIYTIAPDGKPCGYDARSIPWKNEDADSPFTNLLCAKGYDDKVLQSEAAQRNRSMR